MASGTTTTHHPPPPPPAAANRDEDEFDEVPAGATVASRTGRPAVLTTPAGLAIAIDATCLNPTTRPLRHNKGAASYIRIGRQQATADIRIQHSSISRRHAILYYNYDQPPQRTPAEEVEKSMAAVAPARDDDDEVLYLQSWGVTLVNGQKQAKGAVVALSDGDTVQFGTVRENVFTIRIQQQKGEKNKVEIDASVAASSADATPQPPNVMLSDQERLERAGEGLSGRDKRQAEIQAMMISLDETPVYTQTADEVQRQVMQRREEQMEQQSADEAMARRQLTTQYQLPVSQTFVVAGPDTATTATGVKKAVIATCLAVDPAGARFVVGGRDTTVRLYDFGGMDQRRHGYFHSIVPEPNHVPVALAYSNTGDRLLVATGGLQPIVLDRDGRSTLVKFIRGDVYVSDCTKTIGHTAAVTAVAWHPVDRDVVATAGRDGSVRLWDLNNGKRQFDMLLCGKVFPIKNQKQHRTVVTCLAFHPIGGREFVVGTECGSVQIWNRARVSARPERAVYGVHNGGDEVGPIASVAYSLDGTKIATRSFNDHVAKVWDAQQLGRSASASLAKNALLASCGQAVTLHEQCNAVFDPPAKRLCLAVSFMKEGDTEPQTPPVERGAIHIYDITQPNDASTPSTTTMLRAPLLIVPLGVPTGGTIVHWHHPLNQIFVACANGQAVIYFDAQFSNKGGAVAVTKKAGKSVDALEELLKAQKTSRGNNTTTGPIIAPLHREDFNVKKQPLKRKRADDEKKALQRQKMEPERPNTYKHKTGAQVGGAITFQQFVADQRIEKTKEIAGKDPRVALLQYSSDTGQSSSFVDRAYQGNVSKLADKTAEQEQEENGGDT